jgi:hypothetical protein
VAETKHCTVGWDLFILNEMSVLLVRKIPIGKDALAASNASFNVLTCSRISFKHVPRWCELLAMLVVGLSSIHSQGFRITAVRISLIQGSQTNEKTAFRSLERFPSRKIAELAIRRGVTLRPPYFSSLSNVVQHDAAFSAFLHCPASRLVDICCY